MTQTLKDNIPLYQSFMTAPEWKNVEISEDLAEFLHHHDPIYNFVFLREAYDINCIFYHTLRSSLKYNTLQELTFPDSDHYNYLLMDLFVILMTNISMFASKLYCWFVQLMMFPYTVYAWYKNESIQNKTDFQTCAADYYVDYVEQLNLMPFYNINYQNQLQNITKNYQETQSTHTWTDFWTYWYIRLEINSKLILSYLMKSEALEPDLTLAKVAFTGQGNFKDAFDKANSQFLKNLQKEKTPQDDMQIIDKNQFKITTPRYMHFRLAIQSLAQNGIHLEELAGQKRVQVKLEVSADSEDKRKEMEQICTTSGSDYLLYDPSQTQRPDFKPAQFLYAYPNGLRTKTFFMMDMPVYHLDTTLSAFEEEDFKVKFVHNF